MTNQQCVALLAGQLYVTELADNMDDAVNQAAQIFKKVESAINKFTDTDYAGRMEMSGQVVDSIEALRAAFPLVRSK